MRRPAVSSVPRFAPRWRYGALLACLAVLALTACGGDPPEPRASRIAIRAAATGPEFYDVVTGERFVPRGHNLVEFRHVNDPVHGPDWYDMVLSPSHYDRVHLRADLLAMRGQGYNVVRVMLETCSASDCIGPYPDMQRGLSGAYLDRVADLLALAAETDMYVWITSNTLPDYGWYLEQGYAGATDAISASQALFLTGAGIEAHRAYVHDLFRGLVARDARLDRMFSYSIRNEYWYDLREAPWTLSSGTVALAGGERYDMSDPAERTRLAEDGLVRWANAVTAAVREELPTALVSIGMFAPDEPHGWRPGDVKFVRTARALREVDVDFFDLHAYPLPAGPTLAEFQQNFGAVDYDAKPLVLGEFGAFTDLYADVHDAAQAMADWQADACGLGYDGWLTWHWHGDPPEVEGLWGAEGTPIGEALAPAAHPDPCARVTVPNPNLASGADATASHALPDEPASNAVDGAVAQWPEGGTVHELWGGATRPPGTLLRTFSGATADGDVLEHAFDPPVTVRYLRVLTTASPSWVSWKEIEAYGP